METININGVEYVRADQITQKAEPLDGMPYCIVRGKDSGSVRWISSTVVKGRSALSRTPVESGIGTEPPVCPSSHSPALPNRTDASSLRKWIPS